MMEGWSKARDLKTVAWSANLFFIYIGSYLSNAHQPAFYEEI